MAFEKPTTNKRPQQEEQVEKQQAQPERKVHPRVSRQWTPGVTEQGRAAQFCKMIRTHKENNPTFSAIVKEPDAELAQSLSSAHGFVVYADRIDNDLFWHLIVFESDIKPVRTENKKVFNRGGRNRNDEDEVMEFSTTTDSIDEILVDTIGKWVEDNIRVDGEYLFTNATVIPAELDLDAANVAELIAFDSEDSNVLISDTDEPFTADLLRKNSQLRCKLDFNPTTTALDLTGLPLRSDFQLNIEERFRENTSNILLAKNGTRSIVSATGFVNARWVGHDQSFDRIRNSEDFNPACYVPEVVATEVNPYYPDVTGGNFERFFLAIASLPYLKDGDAWMKQFESSLHATSKVSGLAYGMDWPEGIPEDLTLVDEDPNESENWLNKVFHATDTGQIPVDFALLIKEGGIGYTTSKLLLDVADNVPSAISKVVNVLDNLTGQFNYDIKSASDIVAGQVRVPTGYYRSANGIRPIEDLDTMFVFNQLKDNHPDLLESYIECTQIEDRRYDADTAMTKMIKVLQHVVGGEFILKGFATKLYIEPDFLMAIAVDVQSDNAGLAMELDSTIDNGLRQTRRRGFTGRSHGITVSPFQRRRDTFSGASRGGYRTKYSN